LGFDRRVDEPGGRHVQGRPGPRSRAPLGDPADSAPARTVHRLTGPRRRPRRRRPRPEASIMTEAFTTLVSPVFRQVIQLLRRTGQGECPELEPERVKVVALLEEASRQARASAHLAADFALARHALVYWIDEVLNNAPWP